MTKNARHNRILEIINQSNIETQDEIVEQLHTDGFIVTQATVSRDIRDLRLVKETDGGIIRYVQSVKANEEKLTEKLSEVFSHAVVKVDYALNMVVLKTLSGMASAACAAIDVMDLGGVVGSIAGDDTIMVVTKSEADAKNLFEYMLLWQQDPRKLK